MNNSFISIKRIITFIIVMTINFNAFSQNELSNKNESKLYIFGGFNERVIYNDVYSVRLSDIIKSSVSEIQYYTPLPIALQGHTAEISDNNVFVIGGLKKLSSTGAEYSNKVYTAVIKDGILGGWDESAALPHALGYHSSVIYYRTIYLSGGQKPDDVSEIYSGRIEVGKITEWKTAGNLPKPVRGHSSVIYKKRIFILGGHYDSGYFNDVYSAEIGKDGKIGKWINTTPLPDAIVHFSTFIYGERLYILGGQDENDKLRPSVYSAAIKGIELDTWRKETDMPVPQSRMTASVYEDNVIITGGGFGWSTPAYSDIYVAKIEKDGSIKKWQKSGQLRQKTVFHSAVIFPLKPASEN